MLQLRSLVLYFFLLIFRISINLILNVVYKYNRLSEVFLEKYLKLVLCEGSNLVLLDPNLILLLTKVDLFSKKKDRKKHTFVVFYTNYLELILTLLTKVVIFYKKVFIIQFRVFSLERPVCSVFSSC